ncbi:uncharacterized protein LOC110233724 [Exaiptasia diaphana]|uniref:Uncharacterized protein n=1 Tax=Exaiptasia diaphana TaxID=2652724 RepID=A0A913WVC3_EXADI|nr:uncharacterized protein LOC110233724 [Exaiptasia diaphana]
MIVRLILLVSCGLLVLSQESQYEPVGCFVDKGEARALPMLVANFRGNIDWNDLTKVVKMCAAAVKAKGYDVFAIQFYGECWSGPDAGLTYDEYGPSPDGCVNSTVGADYTNFVYRFQALP